jgi:hypothetical protein
VVRYFSPLGSGTGVGCNRVDVHVVTNVEEVVYPGVSPFAVLGAWVGDMRVSSVLSKETRTVAEAVVSRPAAQGSLATRLRA